MRQPFRTTFRGTHQKHLQKHDCTPPLDPRCSQLCAKSREGAIDLAIRYGPLQDSTLSARKLAESPAVLVAAPSYLEQSGAPESLEALTEHRCLTLHRANVPAVSWQLHGRGEVHTIPLDSPLCGNGYMARRWTLAGMGITLKSLFDVIDDLENGSLVRVLPDYLGAVSPIHAVFRSRRLQPARVRALDAAITARFAERAERCRAWLNRTLNTENR